MEELREILKEKLQLMNIKQVHKSSGISEPTLSKIKHGKPVSNNSLITLNAFFEKNSKRL